MRVFNGAERRKCEEGEEGRERRRRDVVMALLEWDMSSSLEREVRFSK